MATIDLTRIQVMSKFFKTNVNMCAWKELAQWTSEGTSRKEEK
jgi:hypothetical protein